MTRRRATIAALSVLIILVCISGYIGRTPQSLSRMCSTHYDTYHVRNMLMGGENRSVLVADTPSKWEYGLMNIQDKRDICGHDGMIFTFPIALPQIFWNKNTLVDLDIYWMKGGKKVAEGRLSAITKSGIETIASPGSVDAVIEIIH